jgi:putative PIN family toxin of toxin-antitoxin system
MSSVSTLVLDTNAWLDLLVFDDAALHGLAVAVGDGAVRIAIDARALDELARVLRYGALRLDDATAATHLARAARLSSQVDVQAVPLPRCRDPDDQMFLEIAVATRATALLTRDAELLRMAGRMARDHGLAIVEPREWRAYVAAPNAIAAPAAE